MQGKVHADGKRQSQGQWKPGWGKTSKAKAKAVSPGVYGREAVIF